MNGDMWESYGLQLANGRDVVWDDIDDYVDRFGIVVYLPNEPVEVTSREKAVMLCKAYVAQYERAGLPVPEFSLVIYKNKSEMGAKERVCCVLLRYQEVIES